MALENQHVAILQLVPDHQLILIPHVNIQMIARLKKSHLKLKRKKKEERKNVIRKKRMGLIFFVRGLFLTILIQ